MSNWSDERLDRGDEEMREDIARLEGQIEAHRQETKENFAKVDVKFDKIDERFERLDKRFEKVDERFEKADERLATMATRQEMNEGFARLERQIVANRREMLGAVIAIVAALIGFHG